MLRAVATGATSRVAAAAAARGVRRVTDRVSGHAGLKLDPHPHEVRLFEGPTVPTGGSGASPPICPLWPARQARRGRQWGPGGGVCVDANAAAASLGIRGLRNPASRAEQQLRLERVGGDAWEGGEAPPAGPRWCTCLCVCRACGCPWELAPALTATVRPTAGRSHPAPPPPSLSHFFLFLLGPLGLLPAAGPPPPAPVSRPPPLPPQPRRCAASTRRRRRRCRPSRPPPRTG